MYNNMVSLDTTYDIEYRKANGIYYTPEVIVEYMVRETVGRLIEDKCPEEINGISIVDPACGDGNFLVGAYKYLVEYHRKWYDEHKDVDEYKSDWYIKDGILELTETKKQGILLNNIYGVDIDQNAINHAIIRMHELVGDIDLSSNIKCGNSLIGTDYFSNMLFYDDALWNEIKPFDWTKEFPKVFQNGGFDIVIGNPPYGIKFNKIEKEYFIKKYLSTRTILNKQKGSFDSFSLFIELGFKLLKKDGMLIFIVPISITSSESMTALHNILEQNCKLIKISSHETSHQQIFNNAVVNTSIIFFNKTMTPSEQILSTKIYKKNQYDDLSVLFNNLHFIDVKDYKLFGRYPKISENIEINILSKLFSINTKVSDFFRNNGKYLYYRSAGGTFRIITNYSTGSTAERNIIIDEYFCDTICAILSSDLYFWYYTIYSDIRDLKLYEIKSFPIPIEKLTDNIITKLKDVYQRYLDDIERNVKVIDTDKYVNIDSFKRYEIRKSKSIIEEIDDIICPLYGLDNEEINFIKNYEIEFRVDD